MSTDEIMDLFKKTGALKEGHFKLSSGLHSDRYFQCALVLQHPRHAETLTRELAGKFSEDEIDVVIGPALGGITLAYEVGRALNVRAIFAERENGKMTLRRGFMIKPGEKVLVVEDVVTTGGSVKEVIELLKNLTAEIAGVGCIVDRSGGKVDFGCRFEFLRQMEVLNYSPEKCPLCRQGVSLVKPGSKKNRIKN